MHEHQAGSIPLLRITVGSSSIHGKGLITTHAIAQDEQIFVFQGVRIHSPYTPEVGIFSSIFPNALGADDDVWVCPEPDTNLGIHLNHSCNPSAYIEHGAVIRALRPLRVGEEVTVDYSTTESDKYWSMPCHCGEENCRGVLIASDQPYWKRARVAV